MELSEITIGAGLVLWVVSCVALSIIGLNRSAWVAPKKAAGDDLSINEKKIVYAAGAFFLAGTVLIIIGVFT